MKLPHDSLVILADGQRHLILENHGKAVRWDLQVRSTEQQQLQSAGEQGTERPGRYPISGGRMTTVEQTDWKAMDKAAFAKSLAGWIDDDLETHPERQIVLVADAKTLGLLRGALSTRAQRAVLQEIAGDYVHQPIEAIIALLEAA